MIIAAKRLPLNVPEGLDPVFLRILALKLSLPIRIFGKLR
jgi:hypothetical protein